MKHDARWMNMICPICIHFAQNSHKKLRIIFLSFAEHYIMISIATLILSCFQFEYQLRLWKTCQRLSWHSFLCYFQLTIHNHELLCINWAVDTSWSADLRQSNCSSLHTSQELCHSLCILSKNKNESVRVPLI